MRPRLPLGPPQHRPFVRVFGQVGWTSHGPAASEARTGLAASRLSWWGQGPDVPLCPRKEPPAAHSSGRRGPRGGRRRFTERRPPLRTWTQRPALWPLRQLCLKQPEQETAQVSISRQVSGITKSWRRHTMGSFSDGKTRKPLSPAREVGESRGRPAGQRWTGAGERETRSL